MLPEKSVGLIEQLGGRTEINCRDWVRTHFRGLLIMIRPAKYVGAAVVGCIARLSPRREARTKKTELRNGNYMRRPVQRRQVTARCPVFSRKNNESERR